MQTNGEVLPRLAERAAFASSIMKKRRLFFLKPAQHERMAMITVKLTSEELKLLASLASDQLFRREFIDPKMPGHVANTNEIRAAKALIARLQSMVQEAPAKRAAAARTA
jgi:hypothetical protein